MYRDYSQRTMIQANQTRAVRRNLRRGHMVWCSAEGCRKLIKGNWKIGKQHGNQYIIANIFHKGDFVETKFWHISCYQEAGEPQGKVIE